MQETMLTPEEVAQRLKVTERTVYRWLQTGRVRGYKLGARLWRIEPPDLQKFLACRVNDAGWREDFDTALARLRSRIPPGLSEAEVEADAARAVAEARELIGA